MKEFERRYDVVVAGSGGAGLRAGIGAAMGGASVLVLSRGRVNRSGATLLAGANISADIACDGGTLSRLGISDGNRDDTPEGWFRDLVREGFYLNNQRMVKLFVDTAPDRVEEMLGWGLEVHGMEGDREFSVFGSDILDTLYDRAKELGVDFLGDTQFTDLLVEDGVAKGVVCLDILSGELRYIAAKSVVLATGGSHNLFPFNSGSTDLCGDGPGAALRAGCSLVDMEMISFCPTVITYPEMYAGNILPYIFFTLGYGNLKNKFGKIFTHRYLSPKVENLALESEWNKMLLSYALQLEINAGRANRHGGIYFDIDQFPLEVMEELYLQLPSLKKGIYADIMKLFEAGRAVTVLPAAHYFEGGVRVDEEMRTGIPGLFAAGECAGGMFGANRVSAATTEMLVEGARAGESAAAFARGAADPVPSAGLLNEIEAQLLLPFQNRGGRQPREFLRELRAAMGDSLTVLRTGEKLELALATVGGLAQELPRISLEGGTRTCNREWMEYISLRNMIAGAGAILRSALARRESRGVHIREDYPVTDNREFLKNVIVDNTDPGCRLEDAVLEWMHPDPVRMGYTDYIETVIGQAEEEEQ